MNHKKKKNRKMNIIVVACIIVLLVVFAILFAILINFQKQTVELNVSNGNTLYVEDKNEKESDDILVVELNKEQNNISEEENEEETEENSIEVEEGIPYYIKVNNEANVVTIYKKDSSGEYTVPVKAMICSVGISTPTSGVYKISDKYTWRLLVGNVYGQYACRITGSILFHSVPYESKDKSTLEWWEYDKLGESASLGCVRLTVADAKWIYDNCEAGTQVEFYSSSDPGPLGKPTVQKISDYENLRNWDPTDPDEDNPWNEYLENQNSEQTNEVNSANTTVENDNNTVNNTETSNAYIENAEN